MADAVVILSDLITSAMTAQLAKVFREDAKAWNCYIEEQNQHFLRPAFFVKQVLMSQNKLMANNYERFYRMRIMWFPELNSNRKRNQCLAMGEKLLEAYDTLLASQKDLLEAAQAQGIDLEPVWDLAERESLLDSREALRALPGGRK